MRYARPGLLVDAAPAAAPLARPIREPRARGAERAGDYPQREGNRA